MLISSMANRGAAVGVADDDKLHKLCHDGNLDKIRTFVEDIDPQLLSDKLGNKPKGSIFGYTPLHTAVASGKPEVLAFLLERTKRENVNCCANIGYTPLHLAASSGNEKCVRVLLEHGADIGCTDDYGKTPKQTAELSSKSSIVKLLRSEGKCSNSNFLVCTCVYPSLRGNV